MPASLYDVGTMRTGSPRTCPSLTCHRRSRTSGRVLGKLLLVFLAFILIFETVPRFVDVPGLELAELNPSYLASEEGKKFEPHPYLILVPKPGEYPLPPDRELSHSDAGFRGAAIPLEKPAGGLRIACIGGSSTYGTGPSKDAFAWPARLQALLAAERPNQTVEVLNGGAPSWNSFEALGNLAFRVLPYAPDIVIVYLATNDAEAALWPNPTTDNRHYREAWASYRPSPIEPALEKSILYLTWRRYATNYLGQRADLGFLTKVVPDGDVGASLKQQQVPPELRQPSDVGFANFQRNLVSMIGIAQAHGAQLVLMTQGMVSPDPGGNHLTHGATRLAAQSRMSDIVRTVAADRGVPLVDMKPILENAAAEQAAAGGKQTLFVDNVHLTDEGTAFLANTLAAELKRIGVL